MSGHSWTMASSTGTNSAVGPGEIAERRQAFENLFTDHSRAVLGYALRRVARPEDAADVLSEVMLVAWRRLESVPEGDEARYWLIGTARHVVANENRSAGRRTKLGERLRMDVGEAVRDDPAIEATHRGEIHDALGRLRARDREVLLLTAWEGLNPAEIATVLGVRPGTVRARLHRAKSRLRRELSSIHLPNSLLPKEEET